jgi:mitochondrial import inner membrane translocase subunit TIM9
MYSDIISSCFADCVSDFTGEVLSGREKECLKNCTTKFLRLANRMGQQMADKQMDAASQMSALQGGDGK